jgi:hypothetical protein
MWVTEARAISSWGTNVALTPCEAGTRVKEVAATPACGAAAVKVPSGTKEGIASTVTRTISTAMEALGEQGAAGRSSASTASSPCRIPEAKGLA